MKNIILILMLLAPLTADAIIVGYGNAGISGGTDVSDDFNRANANPIGGNWTTVTGEGALRILDQQVIGSTSGNNSAYWNADTFSPTQCSRATLITAQFTYVGVEVRVSPSADTYYQFVNNSNTSYQYYKMVAGTETQLGADVSVTPQANDILTLCISGTTLTAYINGTAQATRTDSSISSGSPGIYVYGSSSGQAVDNWAGWDGSYK